LPFTLSEPETSSTPSSSVSIQQSVNSTSAHAVSTSTVHTTLQGNDQATSTSTSDQVHTVTNGTLSTSATTDTSLSQNSTTVSISSTPITALPQDGGSATNVTMFPAVLQTVTITTTICPSGGWVG
jgi:hypothetical protein